MRKLKVTPLAPNFGADEQLGPVWLGKPRGVAVALHQRKSLVKQPDLHVELVLQRGFERDDFALRFTDQKNFFRAVRLQKIYEPVEPRVLFESVTNTAVSARILRNQLPRDPSEIREIIFHHKGRRTKFTPRKSRHRGTRIAKHHTARAVLIEQGLQQRLARAGPALAERIEVLVESFWVAVKNFPQRGNIFRFKRLLFDDFFRDSGHGAKAFGFRAKRLEIVVAIGIEQAESRKVPRQPELRRRRCEQEQSSDAARQLLDERILGTHRIRRPSEMMRLIDDHNIPAGRDGLFAPCFIAREKRHRRQRELRREKRIFSRITTFASEAARLVVNTEPQIKAP